MSDLPADATLQARTFFETLRDEICAAFEKLEQDAPASLYPGQPGRFERMPWRRGDGAADLGGGVGALMRGRFFEKVGVHVSAVHGELSPEFAKQVKGAEKDPRFRATGISLIAHLRNPHCPAVHMNSRMMVTTEYWFGGGGDLNPTQDYQRTQECPDARHFKQTYEAACAPFGAELYPRYAAWCDEYFFLPHRNEHRGVGGIFYDHHATGDWRQDFNFAKSVARAFLPAYLPLVRGRANQSWTEADRDEQLRRRGRYAEFNLLYDRGTTFGLKTGGNVETILSSLPPEARW